MYSIFVWGTATGMLSMTILADHVIDRLDINPNWKMGYAYYDCYAKSNKINYNLNHDNKTFLFLLLVTDWSSGIYFFLPAGLLAVLYIILILITIIKLYAQIKKNRDQLKELGQIQLKSGMRCVHEINWFCNIDMYLYNFFFRLTSYLRLFILAFMDCLYELCGVLCPVIRMPMTFFNNFFCFGFIHSVLIILLTISRKDVKRALIRWWTPCIKF